MALKKALLYKVTPIENKIPDPAGNWNLPDTKSRFYSADRKVLLVRHVFPRRGPKQETDTNLQDEAKGDYFYIDVPKHFFAQPADKGGDLGDFIANPIYTHTDVLVVQWTGYGKYSGWIDTNVQMRGAGIGTVIEQGGVACAKWS